MVYIQRDVSNWVFEEESGERDEEVLPSGCELRGDLDGHNRWVQGDVSDVVPYLSQLRLSCHLQDENSASFIRGGSGVSIPTNKGGVSRLTQSTQLSLVSRMSSSDSPSSKIYAFSQLLRSSTVLTKKTWSEV